jgi:hypothetical protein
MIAALFNGTAEYFLNILPRRRPMGTSYFAGETIGGVEDVCYPEETNPYERKLTLHFNKAPIPNTRMVIGQLKREELKRMRHRPIVQIPPGVIFSLWLQKGTDERRKSFY